MRATASVALTAICLVQALSCLAATHTASMVPKISERSPSTSSAEAENRLTGTASFSASLTARDYDQGLKDLSLRLYGPAKERLARALESLSKTRDGNEQKARAKLSLAEAYLGLENYPRAKTMLEEARLACFETFGANSEEVVRYYADLAELNLETGTAASATQAADQCLKLVEKNGKQGFELAKAQVLMGRVLSNQNYNEMARDFLKKALPALEMAPGIDRLEYANALASLALVEKKMGNEDESAEQMKKAFAIKDDAVDLTKTESQKGVVKYKWTEGLYGSRQIVDPTYPLKYMVVDGVRVACTVVRSYKHMAVLISLANCSPKPLHLAVGAASLEKLSPGRKLMEYCDPGLIDEVLEEDVILDRTWRRKALCHIQKSRRIPGYLKNGVLDSDDFFGNNEFGLYGAWDSHLRDAPPIVTREQFFYDERPKHGDQEILGFMRGNASVRPTYIETGAARTGVVFFLRDRWDDALVRVKIGNAELQFPFHVAPGQ